MPDPGFKIPNGGMATHLVAKRCDLGSLGVPGPASTPGLIFQIRKNYNYFCRGLQENRGIGRKVGPVDWALRWDPGIGPWGVRAQGKQALLLGHEKRPSSEKTKQQQVSPK